MVKAGPKDGKFHPHLMERGGKQEGYIHRKGASWREADMYGLKIFLKKGLEFLSSKTAILFTERRESSTEKPSRSHGGKGKGIWRKRGTLGFLLFNRNQN